MDALLAEVKHKLCRDLPIAPRAVLCSSDSEVEAELLQLSQHRRHLAGVRGKFSGPATGVLTHRELMGLEHYRMAWQRAGGISACEPADMIVHLGDNPKADGTGWCTWTLSSKAIPTLRRSNGILWSFGLQRPVLLKEQYAAMGFCTFPWLSSTAGVRLYDVTNMPCTYPQARQAIGNAQHVACVGVFTACALASAVLRQSPGQA